MTERTKQLNVTKGKKSKVVSVIICLCGALPVITICFIQGKTDVYSQDIMQKNTTDVRYTKERFWTFPYLFSTICSFLGTTIGVVLDRSTVMIDEHAHLASRYSGSWKKMTKACFDGVLFKYLMGVVTLALVSVIVIILVSDGHWSKEILLTSIFGGICMGPIFTFLLQINTKSTVNIPTTFEGKDMERVLTVALSYCFNDLETDIKNFASNIAKNRKRSKGPVKLCEDRLLLLIPIDFFPENIETLMSYDKQYISQIPIKQNPYSPFSIWHLRANNRVERYYAAKYIKEPLVDLRLAYTKDSDNVRCVTSENWTRQVELLYETLSGILKVKYVNKNEKDVIPCLVPIRTYNNNTSDSLKDGKLMKCIMESIDPQDSYFFGTCI